MHHFGFPKPRIGDDRLATRLIGSLIILAACLIAYAGLLSHQPGTHHLQAAFLWAAAIVCVVDIVVGYLFYGLDKLAELVAIVGVFVVFCAAVLYGCTYLTFA